MTPIAILYYVYAVVLLLGGALGYVKQKSVPSLVAGLLSGILMIVAGLHFPHHPRLGLGLGTAVSVALIGVFARRYATTRKAMPAIPILVFSAVVLVYSLVRLLPALTHKA